MSAGSGAARRAASALGVLGLCALGAHPLLPALRAGSLLGHAESDMPDHVQGMEWVARALGEGRLPWRAGWMFWPDDPVLWFPDLPGAVLYTALRPLGPAAAYDLVVALPLLLTAALMARLAARRTGSAWAGLAAAAVVGPSAFTRGAVHSGLTELLGQWTLVLLLGLATRARSSAGADLAVAVVVGFSLLQSPYIGLSGLILISALAIGGLRAPGGLARLGRLCLSAVGGLLLATPALRLAAATLEHPEAAVDPSTAPGWGARLPAVDLLGFVHPSHRFPDLAAVGNNGVVHPHHLGLVALGLACWALSSRRSARPLGGAAALVGLWLAGPRLLFDGRPVELGGQPILLPLSLLMGDGAPLSALHHPYRLVMAAMPLLGLLVAIGVARLPRPARPVALIALLVELAWGTPAPFPGPTTPLQAEPIYAALAPGPVLDWPPEGTRLNRRYKLQQVIHGQVTPYGVNIYLPEALRRDPLLRRLARAHRGPVGLRATNRGRRPTADPWRLGASAPLPEAQRPAWVVLHTADIDAEEAIRARAVLVEALGQPAHEAPGASAWSWGGPAGAGAGGAAGGR